MFQRRDVALYQEVKNVAGESRLLFQAQKLTLSAMQLKEFVPTQCLVVQKLRNDRGLDQYCGNGEQKARSR